MTPLTNTTIGGEPIVHEEDWLFNADYRRLNFLEAMAKDWEIIDGNLVRKTIKEIGF